MTPSLHASSSSRPVPLTTGSNAIERYYRLHSGIYDATRWSFLFGRDTVLHEIARVVPAPRRILEVGCGTGRNLVWMARRFTPALLKGVDVSAPMLDIARRKSAPFGRRITLVNGRYDAPLRDSRGFDVILFSYALSMFNPGWEDALATACQDLSDRGHIAIVDFHESSHPLFKKWMGVNHVRMDSHLRPKLFELCEPVVNQTLPAYRGLWEYSILIARKKAGPPESDNASTARN